MRIHSTFIDKASKLSLGVRMERITQLVQDKYWSSSEQVTGQVKTIIFEKLFLIWHQKGKKLKFFDKNESKQGTCTGQVLIK